MVAGNALAAVAGFFFGSTTLSASIPFWELLIGLSCVVAAACVCNNVSDRYMDAKMARTNNRAIAAGRISVRHAILFASAFLTLGIVLLWKINLLSLVFGLLGFVIYVFVYTPLKPKTPHALWVGALAGAMPPVVGYVAATNLLDWYAFILFAALFLWQIPHFMAIAYYRYEEYQAAGVPLFVHQTPSNHTRQIARRIFHSSLIVLLFACAALIASPLL